MAADKQVYKTLGSHEATIGTLGKDMASVKKDVKKLYRFLLLNIGVSAVGVVPGEQGGASTLLSLLRELFTIA